MKTGGVNILVACIGNIFQGDDAFGCEVAKVLAGKGQPPEVRVVDFGIRGLDLTYALLDAPQLAILVDTFSGGGQPGTVYTIEPDLEQLPESIHPGVDAHAMDPVQVLRAAQSLGGELGRILLVGCEPADLGGEEGRMGLTEAVAAAVDEAASVIEVLIQKELVEV